MAITSTTNYNCDRCGIGIHTMYGSDQPDGWSTVLFIQPPKADVTDHDKQVVNMLLCPACTNGACDFLNITPVNVGVASRDQTPAGVGG